MVNKVELKTSNMISLEVDLCRSMELSPYEKVCEVLGIQCSFAVSGRLHDVEEKWGEFMRMYPYCVDYEGVNADKPNSPVLIEIQKQCSLDSVSHALDLMIKELSAEVAKTRVFGSSNRSSLLVYSYISINGHEYTLFATYHCHCKTDLKSVVLLAQSFLNLFDAGSNKQSYLFESSYKTLLEKNCLPQPEKRELIMESIPKDVLRYDCTHLKQPAFGDATTDEPLQNCMTSVTMKMTKDEFCTFLSWCRSRHLSVQATLLAVELKVYEQLFNKVANDAKSISFLVPYDLRRFLPFEADCLGLLSETIYPTLPISALNQTIDQTAAQLTEKLRDVKDINSEAFDRYRDAYYCGNMALMAVQHTCSVSNVSSFTVMDGLSPSLKERFVDFHMSGCVRVPCNPSMQDLTIHSYTLVDGTFNCSLTYPYGVIQTSIAKAVLDTFKSIIQSLQ